MIVVWGMIKLIPEQKEFALREMATFAQASRAQPGCHAFHFTLDVEEPNKVHLFEHWEDEASIAAHNAKEHYKSFMSKYYDMRSETAYLVRFEPQSVKVVSGSAPR